MMTSLSDASSVTALTQLDVSHNQLQEKEGEHIAEVIKVYKVILLYIT